MEREIAELECKNEIQQVVLDHDARTIDLLRAHVKKAVGATLLESRLAEADIEKVKRKYQIKSTEYEFDMTLQEIWEHSLRQQIMLLQLKLTAAEDDLLTSKSLVSILSKQCDLQSRAGKALGSQTAMWRKRAISLRRLVEQHVLEIQQLEDEVAYESSYCSEVKSQLDSAQGQIQRLKEELSLTERIASAAQERANLAERTLQQRESLASDRAQLQADMQLYSQDLAKMALETGSVANLKFQQTIANAQAECAAEREMRLKAESKAAAAEERANRLAKEVSRLEKQLEAKNRRVSSLEGALQQREVTTPADHKALGAALNAVGDLVSQLDDSPEEAVVRKLNPNVGRKRGRRKAPGARSDYESDASDDDPTFDIAAQPAVKAIPAGKTKGKAKAKKGRLSNANDLGGVMKGDTKTKVLRGEEKQAPEQDKENMENALPPIPSLLNVNKSTETTEQKDGGLFGNKPNINNGGKRRLLGVSSTMGGGLISSNALPTSQLLFRPPKL